MDVDTKYYGMLKLKRVRCNCCKTGCT